MKICIHQIFAVVAMLLVTNSLFAWSAGGHCVIANIAYDQMAPAHRADIVKILRQHPRFTQEFQNRMPPDLRRDRQSDQDRWIFLQASIWPDLIRGNENFHHPTWHYINLPLFLDEQDRKVLLPLLKINLHRDIPNPLPATDPEKLNIVQALKLARARLADANVSAPRKAVYICWIMHLVGDIHQPLHSTGLFTRGRFNQNDGDRGGNSIRVKQENNLHSLWDGLLGRRVSLNDVRGTAQRVLARDDNKKNGEAAARRMAIEAWLQESHKLCADFVYHESIRKEILSKEYDRRDLRKVDLPEAYLKEAGRRAQRRVVEAGYRLAAVLP